MTPRFSPVSQEIAFVTYTGEQPRVQVMNLENGQRGVLGDFQGFTFAPRFSPDGQRVIMSLGTPDGNSSLLEMDLRSRQARRLTQAQGIDTGPCYSPDGRQITFESDRSSNQQLYVMGADGNGLRRISNGEGRYSTPVWSPRGDYIAFTCQRGGRFLIGVLKPDGSGERILTDGYHNEGPTWAPNGRVLSFFREQQGAGYALATQQLLPALSHALGETSDTLPWLSKAAESRSLATRLRMLARIWPRRTTGVPAPLVIPAG